MPWFTLARVIFGVAVVYAAVELRPLTTRALPNAAFGAVLAAAVILLETRLRQTSLAHLVGALVGGALVAVGLLTRPAAALAAFTMLVALYRHRVDPFAKWELAILYLVVMVAVAVRGAGRLSIDERIARIRRRR